MIKILALNQIPRENDGIINKVNKDVEKQTAVSEYNQALKLLLSNKKEEALGILIDLLNTQLIYEVQPSLNDNYDKTPLSLKYSCFKNISSIQNELGNCKSAFNYCLEAVNLDGKDVNLWHKIGNFATNMSEADLACIAYKQGLRENYNFWPCLDQVISMLFAIPDYISCLVYISIALEKDPFYIKGLILRQHIFKVMPSFRACYKIYDSQWTTDLESNNNFDEQTIIGFINEIERFKDNFIHKSNVENTKEVLITLSSRRSLIKNSWLELGKCLIDMYKYFNENNLNFINNIEFTFSNSLDAVEKNDTEFHKTLVNKIETTCSSTEEKICSPTSLKSENYFPISEKNHSNQINTSESNNKLKPNYKIQPTKTRKTNDTNNLETENFNLKKYNEKNLNEEVKAMYEYQNETFETDCNMKFNPEKSEKVKKRRRSSLSFLRQWAWSNDKIKRSSRGRTSGQKESVTFEENLKQIFPSSLLSNSIKPNKEDSKEDSLNLVDFDNSTTSKTEPTLDDDRLTSPENSVLDESLNRKTEKYFESDQELGDVNIFIQHHSKKSNILLFMAQFLEFLSIKWDIPWPDDLLQIYIEIYKNLRKHMDPLSQVFESDLDSMTNFQAKIILLFCELYVDKLFSDKSFVSSQSEIDISSEDLGSLSFYVASNDTCNEDNNCFLMRLLWLRANLFLRQGDTDLCVETLKEILLQIQQWQIDSRKPYIKLINCKNNSIISLETVMKRLNFIQRGKKLHNVKYLYESQNFHELSLILEDTYNLTKQVNHVMLLNEISIDRVDHIKMLLDSLWQIRRYEDCFTWAEVCLDESWYNYSNFSNVCSNEEEKKEKWLQSLLFSLQKLSDCISEVSTFAVRYLSENRRLCLVQNLVQIVCHQLDILDNAHNIPIRSISPWIILHHILLHEEDKQQANTFSVFKCQSYCSLNSESEEDEEDIPASIKILLKGHEFLGQYGLCCIDDGKLLKFIMNLIIPRLHLPLYSSIKQKLKKPLEQSIYCLYGYPMKFSSNVRSKPKYLNDHVKHHINMTWEASQLLFEYYKPENLPTFDSKRIESISMDIFVLFKKIINLIPPESDPVQLLGEIDSFLLGHSKKMPCIKKPLPHQISYIFYLIADFYFKDASNQSWENAIKFYALDACVHPNEFNSWAGLAMSTSTLMETWLNNFQPNINEEKYLIKALIAQRSYEVAIDLSPSNLTVWTEFGNFLYTVHSFCSRLLKQESDSLNMERFGILESKKEEMLEKAKDCFTSAHNIFITCGIDDELQDERWLYQYMLAKIAEKKNEDPQVFLKHYSAAERFLYENNAVYPKKISHKNAPNLALETLEVDYRIHASILKYLEQHEDKPLKKSLTLEFETSLKNCLKSPFMIQDLKFDKMPEKQKKVKLGKKQLVSDRVENLQIKKTAKRHSCEADVQTDKKKIKVTEISHLQLMQDVVSLTDDLITKVCGKVSPKKPEFESACEPFNVAIATKSEQPTAKNFFSSSDKESALNYKKEIILEDDHAEVEKCTKNDHYAEENYSDTNKKDRKIKKKMIEGIYRKTSEDSVTYRTSSTDSDDTCSSTSGNSSSSDDSSDSSSSSLDSNSIGNNEEKRKDEVCLNEGIDSTPEEVNKLIEYCLAGLERCVLRFPEHYKSIYRLAYFFFHNKVFKNTLKSKQLLLSTYKCQYHTNRTIQGLFAERKSTNFFNGIWRIPVVDIDRPGSFASHMSRCITLLMQVLNETGDSKMLTELCIQLRKSPDADKKYLRDTERKQLSYQALTLCLQCLRNRIRNYDKHEVSLNLTANKTNELLEVLLDIYYTYLNVRNMQEFETVELPKIQKLMEDTYLLYIAVPIKSDNIFELAKEFCRQKTRSAKIMADASINTHDVKADVIKTITTNSAINFSTKPDSLKPQKMPVSMKPHGHLPDMSDFSRWIGMDSLSDKNRFIPKHYPKNPIYPPNPSNLPLELYANPFFEPKLLSTIFGSNFNVNLKGLATNDSRAMGTYRSSSQQFPNNFSVMEDRNVKQKVPDMSTNFQNLSKSKTSLDHVYNVTKERPDISITPVAQYAHPKNEKFSKYPAGQETQSKQKIGSAHFSDAIQITPTPQFSLLKPSHIEQSMFQALAKNLSHPTESSLTSNRNPSFHQSIISNDGQVPAVCLSSYPRNKPTKKRNLQSNEFNDIIQIEKKIKQSFTFPKAEESLLVHKASKPSSKPKASNKPKIFDVQSSASCTDEANRTYSVLSQLQQHSHLEIIPQTDRSKTELFIGTSGKNNKSLNIPESLHVSTSKGNVLHHDSYRNKFNTSFSSLAHVKKQTKPEKNDVEIITLDD